MNKVMTIGRLKAIVKTLGDELLCKGCGLYGNNGLSCNECMKIASERLIKILEQAERKEE